jgi:hypothetical protein
METAGRRDPCMAMRHVLRVAAQALLERDDSDFFFLDDSHSSFTSAILCKRSDRTVAYGLMFSSVHTSFTELTLSNS